MISVREEDKEMAEGGRGNRFNIQEILRKYLKLLLGSILNAEDKLTKEMIRGILY